MDRAGTEHSLMNRLIAPGAAALLAIALLGASAGAVLAGPESGVDVVVHDGNTETVAAGSPPTACTFHLHFQASTAISGAFEIRADDDDGPAVADGLFDTTSGDSRAPASGVYELDEGLYFVIWDDEIEMDHSYDQQAIEVVCEAPSPTGTEAPIESESPSPTGSELPAESEAPSPTGSELPAESEQPAPTGSELPIGGEAPTGGVAGVTVTPPATDTTPTRAATASSVELAVAVLLGLSGMLVAWAMRLRTVAEARRIRRR